MVWKCGNERLDAEQSCRFIEHFLDELAAGKEKFRAKYEKKGYKTYIVVASDKKNKNMTGSLFEESEAEGTPENSSLEALLPKEQYIETFRKGRKRDINSDTYAFLRLKIVLPGTLNNNAVCKDSICIKVFNKY